MSAGCSEYCDNKGCQREAGCPAGGLSPAEVRAIQFQADTDRAAACCNHDCDQGDDCPNRAAIDTEGPGALFAALMCGLAMLVVSLVVVAAMFGAAGFLSAYKQAHTADAAIHNSLAEPAQPRRLT